MEALAQGDLDAIPDSLPAQPSPAGPASYESLYGSLYEECLRYLRGEVPPEAFSQQAVEEAARRWEEHKRKLLEKQLTDELEQHLMPGMSGGRSR